VNKRQIETDCRYLTKVSFVLLLV